MQMVSAVQSMYSPITDGIYPQMVKNKNWKLVEKTAKVFMSIVTVGCIFTFVVAKYALLIIGGEKLLQYHCSEHLFHCYSFRFHQYFLDGLL